MMELLNKLDACQEAKQWAAGRCGVNYPTCGEISCEECNDRYEKAMDRIAELEAMVREFLAEDIDGRDRHAGWRNNCTSRPDSQYSIDIAITAHFSMCLVGGSGGHRGGKQMDQQVRPQIDAKTLYEKYAETFQRLRPNNTLSPMLWNDLPTWLQAMWVELAIYVTVQAEECKS